MTIEEVVNRKDNPTIDHYSGKKLSEFSLSENEFRLLVELERVYLSYQRWNYTVGLEHMRSDDIHASKSNLLNYLKGLKSAFDIVTETQDGFKLGLHWQASLY